MTNFRIDSLGERQANVLCREWACRMQQMINASRAGLLDTPEGREQALGDIHETEEFQEVERDGNAAAKAMVRRIRAMVPH